MAVVVSIDAGTTGVRSFALDETGKQLALSYQEFTQHYPNPGWVEHDPTEIWNAVQFTLSELSGRVKEPIAAIGITNQRETVVAWNRKTSEPLCNAIVWQDLRTSDRCEQLLELGHLDQIRETTGLLLNPYFTATKIEWLLKNKVVEKNSDLAFGTIDSWLLWKLTDGSSYATDVSNASRTLLYDIKKNHWSSEVCELFGIPQSTLPEVLPSSGRFGTTSATTAVGAGIPISGIAGDQQSALFGQACLEPGMTKNTYGTGSFVLMNAGSQCPEPAEGLLTTVAWDLGNGPTYALEGSIFVTGAAIQWLRDGLGVISHASEISDLAKSVPDNGGVYFVPAFAGLGSPWWDTRARGTIIGITGGTERGHLARAVVEAMAFQTRDVVEAMSQAAGTSIGEMRVDGGASVMDLLLQIQANQLGVRVARPIITETTAQGAAMLAGLAEGVWSETGEIHSAWRLDKAFDPQGDRKAYDAEHERWLQALDRSKSWVS
tara:strand:+ start:13831 stop:15300 length:1470 start_codon:yes stop_codon:yes gene_type:complete